MKLPVFSADISKRLSWEPPQAVLAKWDAEIHAKEEPDNSISIYDQIGSDWMGEGVTVKRIAAALRSIGEENDVVVNINSPGGSMFEGVAIYNTLREHKGKVTVKVLGLAASAASIIAMAGDEIQVAKSGFLMIHNAWVVAMGNRHDLAEIVKTLVPFDDAMAEIYTERTGLEAKKISKMMDAETWIGGEEAVELGFADALLPSDAAKKDGEGDAQSALRRLETALAKSGMPRSERRALIKEFSDTPRAVGNNAATPGAGDNLGETLESLKTMMQETLLIFTKTKENQHERQHATDQ